MFRSIFNRGSGVCLRTIRSIADNAPGPEKASRQSRRKAIPNQNKSSKIPIGSITAGVIVSFGAYAVYDIYTDSGVFRNVYKGSSLESFVQSILDPVNDMFLPSAEKLLPDFPDDPTYANYPAGMPCPPLLILDLEKTLLGCDYDAKHGWRFVKRPGAEKLIEALSGYYEIVLFSERDVAAVEPLLLAIDPDHRCHYFGASHAEHTKKNKLRKRLDYMNRDIRKIILVDDDPDCFEGFERNTILIKPFEDIRDKSDGILLDLIPLLQGIVHHDSRDFRDTLDDLGTHAAEEVVVEYQLRIARARNEEQRRRNQGIGGLIRGSMTPEIPQDSSIRSAIPSPSSLVGTTPPGALDTTPVSGKSTTTFGGKPKEELPPAVKKKGAMFAWLDKVEQDKEELEKIKIEKMNQIHMKKMEEKKRQQDKKAQQEQDRSNLL